MKKTLYDLLGVAQDASPEQIAEAYEKAKAALEQSKLPDPNQAIVLREAFQVLSNKQKRNVYDGGLAAKQAAISVHHVEEDNAGRIKWIIATAVLVALAAWIVIKKTAHNEPPAVLPPTAPIAAAVERPQTVADEPSRTQVHVAQNHLSAEELYARISPSVARVNVSDEQGNLIGIGSAVVVGRGEVITNCHVAKMGANLELNFRNEVVSASVITADEFYDLCLLRANGLSAPPVETADMSSVHTGQAVFAIGAPQGLELTISEGIVSSMREVPDAGVVIQTSAAISPGSSGGGLFDNSGRLIGITTFQSRSGQNLNFAVPAEWIKSMSTRSGGGIGSLTMGH